MKPKIYPDTILTSADIKSSLLHLVFQSNQKYLSASKLKALPLNLKKEIIFLGEQRGIKTNDIQESVYWLMHELSDYPKKCVECGNPVRFRSYSEAYMYERCSSKCANNSGEVKAQKEKSYMERFGVRHHLASDQSKRKIKDTCFKNCGYESNMQNKDLFLKNMKSQYRLKDYILPSGKIIKLMGYEPQVLAHLLETEYAEEDFDFENIPSIRYDSNRVYFPDFFIPKENLLIEVKSSWTYKTDLEKNKLKAAASRQVGFKHITLIWDKRAPIQIIE